MKIRIIENAASLFEASLSEGHVNLGNEMNSELYRQTLRKIQGTVIEVETIFLFAGLFNTVPIPDVAPKGLRIIARYVAEVIDDERPGKARCEMCGNTSTDIHTCSVCEGDHGLLPFVLLPGQTVVCWQDREKAYAVIEEAPCMLCGEPEPGHLPECINNTTIIGVDMASGKDKAVAVTFKDGKPIKIETID